ncbi:hypothetical protein ACFE04_025877 [Oxalis oulophora]
MDSVITSEEIIIVGAGISGLATALALHRKGIRSVVLERSESLRAVGAGIAVLTNGWAALDQLGVASKLRQTALPIKGALDVWLDTGKQQQVPVSIGETRCLKRSDLISTLASELPTGTIRFSSQLVSVNLDKNTSLPIIQLHDGTTIKAKVLIGCDGVNSVISNFLALTPTKIFSSWAVRGFTHYPHGHGFSPLLVRLRKGNIMSGRAPINDNLVFWFVVQGKSPDFSADTWKDPDMIRRMVLETIKDFPKERTETVMNCDLASLSLTHLRYRAPWDIYFSEFRKGNVTVAGDAMHVMGPFLGQGGSAAMEDAIVLARCLASKIESRNLIGEGLDEYVKERRMRLLKLSTQTFVIGSLLDSSSLLIKILLVIIMIVFFRNPTSHTRYYCGKL